MLPLRRARLTASSTTSRHRAASTPLAQAAATRASSSDTCGQRIVSQLAAWRLHSDRGWGKQGWMAGGGWGRAAAWARRLQPHLLLHYDRAKIRSGLRHQPCARHRGWEAARTAARNLWGLALDPWRC